jgi:hypothetical protein
MMAQLDVSELRDRVKTIAEEPHGRFHSRWGLARRLGVPAGELDRLLAQAWSGPPGWATTWDCPP